MAYNILYTYIHIHIYIIYIIYIWDIAYGMDMYIVYMGIIYIDIKLNSNRYAMPFSYYLPHQSTH